MRDINFVTPIHAGISREGSVWMFANDQAGDPEDAAIPQSDLFRVGP